MQQLVRVLGLSHAAYADATIVRAGTEIAFLAGACPLNLAGSVVAPGDIAEQTRQALSKMDVVLAHCLVALKDVTFLRVLVVATKPDELGLAWGVVREHFGDHDVPATLQGVPVLRYPAQLVEIEPVAIREPR